MAFGGGTFVTQNKPLPGAYINFVSAANASSDLSGRGIVAMPFELDWGIDGEVFSITNEEFQKNCVKLLGFPFNHEKLKGFRDVFKNARLVYAYKLNSAGAKAENEFATAKYGGVRGNDLKIIIQSNVDDESKFDVKTALETTIIDVQTVGNVNELKSNDFVDWKSGATLAVTAATPLKGGSNGDAVSIADYQTFLNKIESYSYNVLGVVTEKTEVNQLINAFVKRMRDEMGVKCQAVTYANAADFEGIINVKNDTTDSDWSKASLVYWVSGAAAGCEINASNMNKLYDGEFIVNADFTQAQLETAINGGEFMLHKVGTELRVLADINSLVTVTDEKGEVFKDNQTIRVVDQIANDVALLFRNKYLGKVPNDAAGRISLWTDIVKHHEQLQNIRAIENFLDADIVVNQGESKKAVVITDAITVVNAMTQLYMTVTVA